MLDDELAEIVDNLRTFGTDVADVEVKKALGGFPKSVRETLSSFSNTKGGVIILGLDEQANFAATGLTDAAKMAADLASCCSNEIEPPLRPLIQIHSFEVAEVVVAELPELDVSDKPCFYKGAGITKGSYIRVNDGDQLLTSYEVQVLLSGRGQPRDDEQAVPDTSLEDLNPEAVDRFVERLRKNRPYAFPADMPTEDVLRRAKVLVTRNHRLHASMAGLLSLGDYPQSHLPQLMLTFVHFPTKSGGEPTTGERFIDNVALEGPIPVIVRDTMAVLRRNMARRSVVNGGGRADTWEYPETALREAVVNALVHRDLSSSALGTQVQVEMYPDRLLIRSPGGLFGPVSLQDLGEAGISSSRNATLLKILEDVPMPNDARTVCENRGSGIRAMIDALREARMSLPKFDDRISTFTVTFPNHTLMSDEVVAWITSLGEETLTDSQCIGLAKMREGERLDNLSYRTLSGMDSRHATAELQDLVARELVLQEGTRRWTQYRLADRLLTRSDPGAKPRRHRPTDRRQEILHALGNNVHSRAELVALTGLNDQIVYRWLRILREEGEVEITGTDRPNSKRTRYRRVEKPQPALLGQATLFDDVGEG
jgi:ATP-dependent DNA helicase RecG